MLGRKKLNYVQLETCLCEVEAVMNSRPLTYVTEDQDDLIPLTPAMFIQDIRETSFPEDEALGAVGLRLAFVGLKKMRKEIGDRFRKEYLALLVQRGKEAQLNLLQVGDVMLVGADNKKRQEWVMARVIELCPGKDGKVRVAKVKTPDGILLRPLQRLYPLEVASSRESLPIQEEAKRITKKNVLVKSKEVMTKRKEPLQEVKTRIGRLVKSPDRFGI